MTFLHGYIDSHAHLTSDGVFEEADQLAKNAWQAGLRAIVNICTDAVTLQRGIELKRQYPWIYLTASTTPHDVAREGEKDFEPIAAAARQGELVGIGETGLDYYYEHSPKEIQQEFFRRYIKLALECNLPLVIHCRDAFSDLYQILDESYSQQRQSNAGVLHCFTGSLDEAQEGIARGWYISFSGILTFKKSQELRDVAKVLPLERLLIETDTPYLAPQAYRGGKNQPAYLPEIARCLADLLDITEKEVMEVTAANAAHLFRISL